MTDIVERLRSILNRMNQEGVTDQEAFNTLLDAFGEIKRQATKIETLRADLELVKRYGKTSNELADEAERGYDLVSEGVWRHADGRIRLLDEDAQDGDYLA